MNNGTSISRTDMQYYFKLYTKAQTVKDKTNILTMACKHLSVQDWMKFFDAIARWNDERNDSNKTE